MGSTGVEGGDIGRHQAQLHNDIAKAVGAATFTIVEGEATDRIRRHGLVDDLHRAQSHQGPPPLTVSHR